MIYCVVDSAEKRRRLHARLKKITKNLERDSIFIGSDHYDYRYVFFSNLYVSSTPLAWIISNPEEVSVNEFVSYVKLMSL